MNTPTPQGQQGSTNLAKYRIRAEVDWIETEVTTASPTNFQTVKRWGGFNYVEPMHPGPGGATSTYRLRLQAPRNCEYVRARLIQLASRIPLAIEPTIVGVEVSLDAYSRHGLHSDLVEMAARWATGLTTLVSKNRRFSGRRKGDVVASISSTETRALLSQDRVYFVGDRDADLTQRIYVKCKDDSVVLHSHKHRARVEVTMRNEALGASTLTDWGFFQFESLATYFRFRKQKAGLDLFLAHAMQRSVQIGERKSRLRAGGGTRVFGKGSTADITLNKAARDALRELSRRWAHQPGT
ncbi:MAG: hypothetical protein AB7I35_18805 [Ramlibacter sp.]